MLSEVRRAIEIGAAASIIVGCGAPPTPRTGEQSAPRDLQTSHETQVVQPNIAHPLVDLGAVTIDRYGPKAFYVRTKGNGFESQAPQLLSAGVEYIAAKGCTVVPPFTVAEWVSRVYVGDQSARALIVYVADGSCIPYHS